jgi:hypothetical protein
MEPGGEQEVAAAERATLFEQPHQQGFAAAGG